MRIGLRQPVGKDRERVWKWRTSEPVASQMFTRLPSRQAHDAWFDRLGSRRDVVYRIVEAEGMPVGAVYVTNIDEADQSGELGYYVGDPRWRGLGVTTVALGIIIGEVFSRGIRRLQASVKSGNTPSRKLLARLGFKQEAPGTGDEVHFLLLAEDWIPTQLGDTQPTKHPHGSHDGG